MIKKSFIIIAIIVLFSTCHDVKKCVDFESLDLGTQYGAAAGNESGDFIFTENHIAVSVHDSKSTHVLTL